ncbi:MAG: hypothetical protein WCB68_05860, partial [Pyrinomonadaceae bacterium]
MSDIPTPTRIHAQTSVPSLGPIPSGAVKSLEQAGKYEEARGLLSGWWRRIGERPDLAGLDVWSSAELLLRAGALSAFIGDMQEIVVAQEFARNLLTEALRLFEQSQLIVKQAECLNYLAICYLFEARLREAHDFAHAALQLVGHLDLERRAIILKDLGIIARSSQHVEQALDYFSQANPLFEQIDNLAARGNFHNAYAIALQCRWTEGRDPRDRDLALEQLAAASGYLERAGSLELRAVVENNLGWLLYTAKMYKEAHAHLNTASRLFKSLNKLVHSAYCEETRAQVYLAEGQNGNAERAARMAVRGLELSNQRIWLAEACITHGRALTR